MQRTMSYHDTCFDGKIILVGHLDELFFIILIQLYLYISLHTNILVKDFIYI